MSKGVVSYRGFVWRITAMVTMMIVAIMLLCLLLGDQSSGGSISAFTTNSLFTTDVWVMDVSRSKYVRFRVSGHANDIPVWSTEERRIVYYPRIP
jgi:hypothetical protein